MPNATHTTAQANECLIELGYLEDKDGLTTPPQPQKVKGGQFNKGKHGYIF